VLANNKKSKAIDAPSFLAFDIGADSGRAILGWFENRRLKIKELTRFANGMVSVFGHWHWNIYRIFEEIKKGMKVCAAEAKEKPQSAAFDTWGVDFALLTRDGSFLGLPYAYRDSRTEGAMEEFFKKIPRRRVYELTGIQFLQFNSLFQLFSMKRDNSPLMDAASDLLFMPDIFNYLFTREKKTEFTYATTSQLYNPKSISQETGIGDIPVIAVASHDTGSAVGAVPAEGKDWAYISSGTWSLMGVETREPVINDQALGLNFTNEGGVGGTFRFLRNITGFWLLQECRRAWAKKRLLSYDELIEAAVSASPFRSLIEPDWSGFLNPPDMPEAIRKFCRNTKQKAPDSSPQFVRCILESLALKYRHTLDQLRKVYAHPIRRIHVIGGGAKNRLLNQLAANATNLPVITGPVEATAVGNIMVQALALGYFSSHSEVREVIGQSFELERYEPRQTKEWDIAYERFKELKNFI
jgi:rhamnulokinase